METNALTEKQKYWKDHLQRCTDQGIGLAEYARQHDLDVNRLYHWKSVLARRASGVKETVKAISTPKDTDSFIRAIVKPASTSRVVIPNGIVIEFPNGIDETVLTLLARLRIAV
jgi:hypothetical protein